MVCGVMSSGKLKIFVFVCLASVGLLAHNYFGITRTAERRPRLACSFAGVDFSPLIRTPGNEDWSGTDGGAYTYKFNVCAQTVSNYYGSDCQPAGMQSYQLQGTFCTANIDRPDEVTWETIEGVGVSATYTSSGRTCADTIPSTMTIIFLCNPSAPAVPPSSTQFCVKEDTMCNYRVEMPTSLSCAALKTLPAAAAAADRRPAAECHRTLPEVPARDYSHEKITRPVVEKTAYSACSNNFTYNTLFTYGQGNTMVFSPHSVMTVVAMLYYGTSGGTEQHLMAKLGLPARKLILADLSQINSAISSTTTEFKTVNMALFSEMMQKQVKTDYLDAVSAFGSVEFFSNGSPKATVDRLNTLVADNTNNLIRDFLPPNFIKQDTVAVLLNCIYFIAAWEQPFVVQGTRKQQFHSLLENRTVDMMIQYEKTHKYASTDRFQVLQMDYKGGEFGFAVILPKTSKLDIPTAAEADELFAGMMATEISTLMIPKFTASTKYDVKKLLAQQFGVQSMDEGVPIQVENMFTTTQGNFFIDQFIHQAVIIVDEKGTEAAGATAVSVSYNSAKVTNNPINFIADHPFTYYIRHTKTGLVVFSGIYQ